MMAFKATGRFSLLAAAIFFLLLSSCKYGKADEVIPSATGAAGYDPAQVVARALLCFNDKYIYSSCEESHRLTESGNIKVEADKTDEYCNGPCLTETHLVLNCIDNILSNFVFYNKATIEDVRETVEAGCGYGPERGKFDVAEHIKAEEDDAQRPSKQFLLPLGLMIMGILLLF